MCRFSILSYIFDRKGKMVFFNTRKVEVLPKEDGRRTEKDNGFLDGTFS